MHITYLCVNNFPLPFVEVFCATPPLVPQSTQQGDTYAYDDVVTVTCNKGYEYDDGTTSVELQCLHSRLWSVDIAGRQCTGNGVSLIWQAMYR